MSPRASLFVALLALGCGHPGEKHTETPRAEPSTLDTAETQAVNAPPEETRARVRFDLAEHFERAELRDGETRFLDLGAPGGAKYTWGGWYSHFGPVHEIDGTNAAITTRSRAKLAVAADGRATTIAVRLRAFRSGLAQLYLDRTSIAAATLEADTWQVLEAELDAEALASGEHELTLRFDRGGRIDDVGRAYLAVDWVRLGPASEPANDDRPQASDANGLPTLSIPDGWTVGYPLEVPEGARLRGVLEGEGTLEVWAARDGAPDTQLSVVAGGARSHGVDVALDELAGEVARLELRARGGLRLLHPAVITLDATPPPEVRRPRNVLIYLIDTLRADRLSVYAPDTRVRTPGISRFARDATVMTRARSQENWTKPSVATLLSGLMPWEHTAYSDASAVPQSVQLLPQILHERGFTTAAFIANGYVSGRFGFRRGWDTWRNYIRERRSTRGEHVAADVLQWLDERPAEQPFFLYVHAIDPHVPYRPPETYLRMYAPEPYRGPVDFSRDATLLERIKTGGLRLRERDRRHLEALYDGEVSYQDAQLTSILDGLAHRGLDEDTMVIITADHGEEFWDHGSVGHGHNLYDELVHVPLIVRVPGLTPAPRRLESSVGLVDVPATILDVLGEPVPEEMSGRSLWPSLRGAGESAPSSSVAGFMEHWRSVSSGRLKLITRPGGRVALYDLVTDPDELHDVSAERPLALAFMRGLLGLRLADTRPEGTRSESARPRRRHRATPAVIDAELEAQLEALGYVGTSRRR